jgi:hypothetical protein
LRAAVLEWTHRAANDRRTEALAVSDDSVPRGLTFSTVWQCETIPRHNVWRLGVETHLYLIDYRRYAGEIKPLLDALLDGGDTRPARSAYEEAWRVLSEANSRWKFPWGPIHSTLLAEDFQKGLSILDGHIPEAYYGDRLSLGLLEPDMVTRDPRLVREYNLRDHVCEVIVEGLCVRWNLDFPPVHVVTWCLGWELYGHSKKFEDALCGEIYRQPTPAPYDIVHGDELVEETLVRELAEEIARIASPDSELWVDERYRNLYLLLQHGTETDYRILASYI